MDHLDLNSAINWNEVEEHYDGNAEDMHYVYVFEESDDGMNRFLPFDLMMFLSSLVDLLSTF